MVCTDAAAALPRHAETVEVVLAPTGSESYAARQPATNAAIAARDSVSASKVASYERAARAADLPAADAPARSAAPSVSSASAMTSALPCRGARQRSGRLWGAGTPERDVNGIRANAILRLISGAYDDACNKADQRDA